jgi:hypothetical protein
VSKWLIGLSIVVFAGGLAMALHMHSEQEGVFRYIITESERPYSLDPLLADNWDNLPVARMVYATPVEVNKDGSLSSKVLESFSYDPSSMTMVWMARPGLRFSDGSEITPADIAFAVARMAYTRPSFPDIEHIVGLKSWSEMKDGLSSLPPGISISGNQITIKFAKNLEHALFRFCLEIFSIIPKRCVNPSTNKVVCESIPTSGYYSIVKRTNDYIEFKSSGDGRIHDRPAPKNIRFEYMLPNAAVEAISKFDDNTVVVGTELRFPQEAMAKLRERTTTVFEPDARIALLLITPTGIFKDKICRRVFAEAYRTEFSIYARGQMRNEASLFTDVLPGYMKTEELAAHLPISESDRHRCINKFKEGAIPWAIAKAENSSSLFDGITRETFRHLSGNDSPSFEMASRNDVREAFADGKVSLLNVTTGFWALDPSSDVQMLLTPNMHKILQFVARDSQVQKLIRDLTTSDNKTLAFKALNQYLFDEGLLNVFAHIRRFYSSPNPNLIAELPISITSPAPWQVFKAAR